MLGVLGVGLDPVAGRPLQLRRRRYHAPDVVVGQKPGQPVAGRSGLVHHRDRAGQLPQPEAVLGWLRELPGPVAVVYEAGPTGYGLARFLTDHNIRCVVSAPSKLQRPSGDRVKTDAKDAQHLARLLRLDEITPVVVPTVAQEAARDLVRAREDVRGDLMRARTRSRAASCATVGTTTGVISSRRSNRARCWASLASVLTRSPDGRCSFDGAATTHRMLWSVRNRASP